MRRAAFLQVRGLKALIALVCVGGTVVAAPAAASPSPTIASARVGPDPLFANTPTRFGPGIAWVEGLAPGASSVEVTVSDDLVPPRVLTTTIPTHTGAIVNFEAPINVTDFGPHGVPDGVSWPRNVAPNLLVPVEMDAEPGEPVAFTVAASDPDGEPVTVEATGLPKGASFDGSSLAFAWTPTVHQRGEHTVVFAASDGRGGLLARAARILVSGDGPSNAAPELGVADDASVEVGSDLTFAASASDPDGDPVTVEASGLPPGATFTSGAFFWEPSAAQHGWWDVLFTASDGRGAVDVAATRITVFDPKSLGQSTLTFTLIATAPNGESSTPIVLTMRKFAATPGDVTSPIITMTTRPPPQWCHILADKSGRCVDVGQAGSIQNFWALKVVCPATVPFTGCSPPSPNAILADPTNVQGHIESTLVIDGDPAPVGEAQIAGRVEDLTSSSLGVASQIAEIRITVIDPDDQVVHEERPILRAGPRGYFSTKLRISDFEPGPAGRQYRWEVQAEDAWGNQAEPVTGTFNVFAW